MQIEIAPHIVTTRQATCCGMETVERDTGQIRILIDGKLSGFLGPKDGNGIRMHGRYTDQQLTEIQEAVRALRPSQVIPLIVQAPAIEKQPPKTKAKDLE